MTDMTFGDIVTILAIPLIIVMITRSLYVIKANERALREFLGKPGKTVESGLRFALWPFFWFTRYSTELVELPLSTVGVLTKKDGENRQIKMNIDAVLYLYWPENLAQVRVNLPSSHDVTKLADVLDEQTLQAVREKLSDKSWTEIWSRRKACGDDITAELKSFGIQYALNKAGVTDFYIVIKHVEPPEGLEKAISDPEIARLEKESAITRGEGSSAVIRLEGQAKADARNMLFSAIGNNPDRVRLELLLTLREMAQGTSNTILFPIPAEITSALSQMFGTRPGLDPSQLLNTLTDAQKKALINLLTQVGNQGGGNP